ncbi:hypothetical protein KIW84_054927 [Lathyrus oleraceus]|uniref:DNA-directed DNA polymerase n=4 Tax=Pisum sativum TaxID=3888 RepID=A0A9D4WZ45_PEA|nr:hypothetical protein KIW84_054927 [Pisum sativum]
MQAVSNSRRVSRLLQSPIFLSFHLRSTEQPFLSGLAQRNYSPGVDNVEETPTEAVKDLYDKMLQSVNVKRSMPPNAWLWSMIENCKHRHDISLLFDVLQNLRRFRLSNLRIHDDFNCSLCREVTKACVHAGALDFGKKALWKHNVYGLAPSVASAHHILTYAKNHNDTNLLVEVMKLLKRNDLPLQPGTADIVFSICYNTDEWELINKYAKRFVKAGVKLRQTSFETWMGFAAKRDFFYSVGLGLGKTDSPQASFRKSISNERTFSATEDEVLLQKKLDKCLVILNHKKDEPCKLMFAVELAEMLSTDMQKEGLHGRTLTLKLKTTSFEVRNRAVTLQNYINSSEDILKHASKLLKAELPVSVRLIGLRVSQFNGDKSGSGATPDRTQKTITNFITSGEANRKKDPFSDVTDHDFISDIETDPSIDVGHTSQLDSRDPFDGNHSLDVNHQSCTLWKNDGAEKVQTSGNDAASSHHSACTEMLGSTSFQGKFEGKNVNDGSNLLEEDRLNSCQETTMLWLNDYKCSLCGIELPPSFVEERLEHSDFHFAEKLQKEESSIRQTSIPIQSQDQKHRINRQSKSKKQKLSQREGRYTPIDYFFVKE